VVGRDNEGVPIYLTKSRLKNENSAFLKIKRKDYSSIEQVSDLLGFRVLCLFEHEIPASLRFLIGLFFNSATSTGEEAGCSLKLSEVIFFNWDIEQLETSILRQFDGWIEEGINQISGRDLKWSSPLSATPTRIGNNHQRDRLGTLSFRATDAALGASARKIVIRDIERGSGYKSIHLVGQICKNTQLGGETVANQWFPIEIQLRTLIQDVWGELEHRLNYKGARLPQIQKSFALLAKELQAKDQLVSDLKELLDKHVVGRKHALSSLDPGSWFTYPTGFEDVLKTYSPSVLIYFSKMQSYSRSTQDDRKTWLVAAFALWEAVSNELKTQVSNIKAADEDKLHYLLGMEEGFWFLIHGKMEKALATYLALSNREEFSENWALPFRLGNIYLEKGETQEALQYFDLCEAILQKRVAEPTAGDILDAHGLATSTAHVYWSLGTDYVDVAYLKALYAYELITQHESLLIDEHTNVRQLNSLSNLCYYMQEKVLQNERDDQLGLELAGYVEALEILRETLIQTKQPEKISVNVYDTLAWCCFQQAIKRKQDFSADSRHKVSRSGYLEWLRKAYDYCMLSGKSRLDLSPLGLYSADLRRQHSESILLEATTCGLHKGTL
jgi:ppGpp synthetase/RelA/SpoT-type nucleotidyltranferase